MQIRLLGARAGLAAVVILLVGCPATADLTSASYAVRGGHVSCSAASNLSSVSFGGMGTLGQSDPIGPSGAETDLTTAAPGFVPIVVGAFANLDLDGDGVAYFLDDDDDGDGLADEVETSTSIFVSASDTGTDSLIADTDGDGFLDGVEVAAGSDPTSALSTPADAQVPGLNPLSRGLVVLALMLGAARARRQSRGTRT